MNAVFTIVAKNYLPLAYTLFESIKSVSPELDLFVFLSDNKSNEDAILHKFEHIYPNNLDLTESDLNDLAFKYNVTEFCTSIKPFCFKYLKDKGYTKIIYFDPDIYVYQSLNFIYDYLDTHFIVITPHYCKTEIDYTGVRNEGMILFSGVYNLGFCALSTINEGAKFIEWWIERLKKYSYADKVDGLHTDQKWIDLVHCIFDEPIKVLKHPGTNAAIWNMHERVIENIGGVWYVRFLNESQIMPLVFYHFSSFNYYDSSMPNKLYPQYKVRFGFMNELCKEYRDVLMKNKLIEYSNATYSFNFYLNGIQITPLHRRIYRRVKDLGLLQVSNPFDTSSGSFFEDLNENNLLIRGRNKIDSQNENNFDGFDSKVKTINFLMRTLKSIIGIEKYFLLVKFLQRYSRFENQYFLISKYKEKYKFLNENRPD